MSGERTCPECGWQVAVLSGFPDWCDRCGWNLEAPHDPWVGTGRFAKIAELAGRRAGDRMASELASAGRLAPRVSPGKLGAYAIALGVHVLVLVLLVGGLALILATFPNPIALLLGVALAGLGLVMRPRLPSLPDDVRSLQRAEAPVLHQLVDEVAGALERPPPDVIALDADWNAGWIVAGPRRRRVLVLGLPIASALRPQELVAILGHEVAHDRNGDARRGLVVGSAVGALDAVSQLLLPDDDRRMAEAGFGGFELLTAGLMRVLALPVDGALWLLARLLWRDMQRAEYLADALGARVAGSQAMVEALETLMLQSAFALAVQRAAHDENGMDVMDRVREAVHGVPSRERERRRRVARLEQARLEGTHPPTCKRIELLEQRPPQPSAVTLETARAKRVDEELRPFSAAAGTAILDAHRGALYSGWR